MTTREKVKIYTQHGGSWFHLKRELINEGMSHEFADYFIDRIRTELSQEHSESCVIAYDMWAANKNEKEAKLSMVLLGLAN